MQSILYKQSIFMLLALWLVSACARPSQLTKSDEKDSQTETYIVVLKKDQVKRAAMELESRGLVSMQSSEVVHRSLAALADAHGLAAASVHFSKVLQGGVYKLTSSELERLAQDPRVAYIEANRRVSINTVQTTAPWGLDRLDQSTLPLDRSYHFSETAANVNVYVIDTGILMTHREFGGRANSGYDFVDNDEDATDCNGHGTHVSGTIASQSYGVAKAAKLIGVRVLDCEGGGSIASVIQGIEWVTTHHQTPAVANMSLGGGLSQAIDDAVDASIQSGVTYVVAAGNDSISACNSSPSRVASAITVGSITQSDARSSFSNYGSCVSLFAPGTDILSTWDTSNTATNTISGTSMATPHVTGVAALYLASHPSATPAAVKAALIAGAVSGKVLNAGSGSPNLLLNTGFLTDGAENPPPPPPTPPSDPCLECSHQASQLSGRNKYQYYQSDTGYEAAAGTQQIWLKGPIAADFDLYLYKKSGSSWVRVASSIKTSSDEQISYSGEAGIYRVKIISYSGSGAYDAWLKLP